MINPVKWWLNRRPFHPVILEKVDPITVDPRLDRATLESVDRQIKAVQNSRALTSSVVTLHEDFLKLIEGKRV